MTEQRSAENDATCGNCGRQRRVSREHYTHPLTTGCDGLCWCPQCACPDCDARHPHRVIPPEVSGR